MFFYFWTFFDFFVWKNVILRQFRRVFGVSRYFRLRDIFFTNFLTGKKDSFSTVYDKKCLEKNFVRPKKKEFSVTCDFQEKYP